MKISRHLSAVASVLTRGVFRLGTGAAIPSRGAVLLRKGREQGQRPVGVVYTDGADDFLVWTRHV